jgi:hypothetical protein
MRDHGFPTFDVVLSPTTLAAQLRRVLPDRFAAARDMRIHIFKRHRNRCTFAIEWQGTNASHAAVGKVYAANRADVYHAMVAIRRSGFGPNDALSIPQPLAYVPELHLLLLEKVSGHPVKRILLEATERERVEAAERSARWLARFHAYGPWIGRPYHVADVLDSVREWSQAFGAAGHVLTGRPKRLAEDIVVAASALEASELCAGHAHYTAGQILIADGQSSAVGSEILRGATGFELRPKPRTVTFDWDGYDVADPCRDLACFLVDLKRLAWKNPDSGAALSHAATVFLQTYLLLTAPRTARNLPFYAAARFLRMARRDIGDDEPERAAAMVEAGLLVLEQGIAPLTEGC